MRQVMIGATGLITSQAMPALSASRTPPDAVPDARRLIRAVVRIDAKVPLQARTAPLLGNERVASGVAISADGLILTIADAVIEAGEITVTGRDGRERPATTVGHDLASGLALIRVWADPTADTQDPPVIKPFTAANLVMGDEVLAITSHGDRAVHALMITDRRSHAGPWEYLLDNAIITSPPIRNHEGAALIDGRGRLIGIGAQLLRDAVPRHRDIPGNLFIPLDGADQWIGALVGRGQVAALPRPWLGLALVQGQGGFLVTDLWPRGPAAMSGLRQGDIITAIADRRPASLAGFWRTLWSLGSAGTEIHLETLRGASLHRMVVRSADQTKYLGLDQSL